MAEMPTARPSSPSMRLTALVQAMIQMMVNGMDSQPSGIVASASRKPGFEMTSKTMPQRIAKLTAQLDPRIQAENVVQRAHDRDDHRAQEQAHHLHGHIDKEQDRQHKAGENGQTAHPRDRVVMDPPPILRNVDRSHVLGKPLDRRCHEVGEQKRDHRSGNYFPDRKIKSLHNECSS